MNILFSVDPWIYRDCAANQIYSLDKIFKKAISALVRCGHNVKLLLGEDLEDCVIETGLNIECDRCIVPLKELYHIFLNHYEAHKKQFYQKETSSQKTLLSSLVRKTLCNWKPEIVFSFTTPASVWNYIFPEALALQFENGCFSREPYPYLCQLDPFGFLSKSYPAIFMTELQEASLSTQQRERFQHLKTIYANQIFDLKNPINRNQLTKDKKQKILLVPLSYNGVIINDEASTFKSQLDFLLATLYQIPSDTVVLATKHSLQMNTSIIQETELFLQKKFKNLSFCKEFEKYAFLSQWLTPLVDGVVTLNSTVAYHAAFWNKKVFTPGFCEINSVSNSSNLTDIASVLSQSETENTSAINVLYHLLTRYCFPLDLLFSGEKLTIRLEKMLFSWKKGDLLNSMFGMPLIQDNEDDIFKELILKTPGLSSSYVPREWTRFT